MSEPLSQPSSMSLHEVLESALLGDSPRSIIRLLREAESTSLMNDSPAATTTTNAQMAPNATPVTGISGFINNLDYKNLFTWIIALMMIKFIIDNLFVALLVLFIGIFTPLKFSKLATINIDRKDRSKASKIGSLLLQYLGIVCTYDLCIEILSKNQFLPKNLIYSRLTLEEYNEKDTIVDMFLTSRLVDLYVYGCFVVLQTTVSMLFWVYYSGDSYKFLSMKLKLGGGDCAPSTVGDTESAAYIPDRVDANNDRVESLRTLKLKKILNIIDCVSFTFRSVIVIPIWYSYFHAGRTISSWISYLYLLLKLIELVWNLYTLFALVMVGVSGTIEYGRRSTLTDLAQCQECSICYEDPKDSMPLTLHCDHSFCELCIVEWLDRDPTCPICRCKVISNFTNQRNIKKEAHEMAIIF